MMEPRNQDADELFKAGMFAEAEQRYAEALRVGSLATSRPSLAWAPLPC